jgi:glutathione S-transferase
VLKLLQFEMSHFCEKARWTLDYKRIAYEKDTLLPGFHVPRVKRLTGQQSVPVLETPDEGYVFGSDRIAAYAERIGSGPALYPANDALRREALALEERFEAVGHHARRAMFGPLFEDRDFARRCMVGSAQGRQRSFYEKTFFATGRVITMVYALKPDRIAASTQATVEALDFVEQHLAGRDYLVGDRFTIADLTAASLLIPVSFPKAAQVPLPDDRPAPVEQWLARFADHPTVAWTHAMFERHRMLDVGRAE